MIKPILFVKTPRAYMAVRTGFADHLIYYSKIGSTAPYSLVAPLQATACRYSPIERDDQGLPVYYMYHEVKDIWVIFIKEDHEIWGNETAYAYARTDGKPNSEAAACYFLNTRSHPWI